MTGWDYDSWFVSGSGRVRTFNQYLWFKVSLGVKRLRLKQYLTTKGLTLGERDMTQALPDYDTEE